MATVYRITIDNDGKITGGIVYSGVERDLIASAVGSNYTYYQYEGELIEPKDLAGNCDLAGFIKNVEHVIVLGSYETREAFEAFLEEKEVATTPSTTYEVPGTPRSPASIRILKNHFSFPEFITRPGTWTVLTLALVLIGVLAPVSAPGLILMAAITTGFAAASLILNIKQYVDKLWTENDIAEVDRTFANFLRLGFKDLVKWADEHRMQAAIVFIAAGLLITTLTLTIGFFTGGAGFTFMAPVFAAIAAPFAAAATAAGAEVSLAALAGAWLVLAVLAVPDAFRRFVDWIERLRSGEEVIVELDDLSDKTPDNPLEEPLLSQQPQQINIQEVPKSDEEGILSSIRNKLFGSEKKTSKNTEIILLESVDLNIKKNQ